MMSSKANENSIENRFYIYFSVNFCEGLMCRIFNTIYLKIKLFSENVFHKWRCVYENGKRHLECK